VHPQAALVVGDLLNRSHLEALFAAHKFEGILHFASHIMVGESMQKPFKYLYDNVVGVMNILEFATLHGVGRFILSSTANLYDDPKVIPIREDEALIPGSVYGETKFMAERMLAWMDRIYGLKYC
jgi:UDP-glucose 4-epimerase